MAGRLILQKIAFAAAVIASVGQASPAGAQSLPDPTRPPSGFIETIGGGTGGTAPVAKEPGLAAAAPAGPQLQSVLLPQNGRPVAIISGRYVPQGERFGGMELISVTEQEVVLAEGKNRRVLKLTPGVEKTVPGGTKPTRSDANRKVAVGKQQEQKREIARD
jgi:MSHA biogenesis protein MshK